MSQDLRGIDLLAAARAKLVAMGLALAVALTAREAAAIDPATCAGHYETAQTLSSAGKLLAARSAYLQCGQSGCPDLLRRDCVKQYDALAQRIPSVSLSARSAAGADLVGATFDLDGAPVSRPVGRAIELDPGPHRVVVTYRGAQESFDLVAREGETLRPVVHTFKEAVTPKEPEPPPKRSSGPSPAIYGLGALGVLGFASFGFFGIRAWQDSEGLHDQCAPRCSSGAESSLRTQMIVADVSLVVGAVATAAFVWLFLDSRQAPARTAVRF